VADFKPYHATHATSNSFATSFREFCNENRADGWVEATPYQLSASPVHYMHSDFNRVTASYREMNNSERKTLCSLSYQCSDLLDLESFHLFITLMRRSTSASSSPRDPLKLPLPLGLSLAQMVKHLVASFRAEIELFSRLITVCASLVLFINFQFNSDDLSFRFRLRHENAHACLGLLFTFHRLEIIGHT
jgi:hypothetical protein